MVPTLHERPARWWHALEGGRLECELCPRRCKLVEGQRGFCFARRASEGRLLTKYGRSSGFCIDPIEKKPLYHFYPGSAVLSFGTAGCNLGCRFCQNWAISNALDTERLARVADPERIAQVAAEQTCRAVAFTYNDPVIFAEYAIDTAAACREHGLKTVAVTAGYIGEAARAEFFAAMDAANVDLKGFSERFYKELCLGALAPVLETLQYIHQETSVWLEITTLLIPGVNDSDEEVHAMTAWIAERLGPDVPLHFTAFHPDFELLELPPTSLATLRRARQIALGKGLRYVYTGNVRDARGSATNCPGCGAAVIKRDGFRIGEYALDEGRCASCDTPIAGHFDTQLGGWNGGRKPLIIS